MTIKPGDIYYNHHLERWCKCPLDWTPEYETPDPVLRPEIPAVEVETVEPWRRLRDSWHNEVDNENANDRNRR